MEWYPVAASGDLPDGVPYRAQLLGQDMVLWRVEGAGGGIRARAARCPLGGALLDRGSRVEGDMLICGCHGAALGGYTGYTGPGAVDETFPAAEGASLIWAAAGPAQAFDVPTVLRAGRWVALWPQSVAAPVELCERLAAGFTMHRVAVARFDTDGRHLHFRVGEEELVLFAQPQGGQLVVLRGVVLPAQPVADAEEKEAIRARYAVALEALASAIEQVADAS